MKMARVKNYNIVNRYNVVIKPEVHNPAECTIINRADHQEILEKKREYER